MRFLLILLMTGSAYAAESGPATFSNYQVECRSEGLNPIFIPGAQTKSSSRNIENVAGFHPNGNYEDVKFEKLAASGVYHETTLRRLRGQEASYFHLKIKSEMGRNQFEYELVEVTNPKDKPTIEKVVKKGVIRAIGKPVPIEIGGITYSCLTVPRKGDMPLSAKRPGEPVSGPAHSDAKPLRPYVGDDGAGIGGAPAGQ